jgi:hypothetical protein
LSVDQHDWSRSTPSRRRSPESIAEPSALHRIWSSSVRLR